MHICILYITKAILEEDERISHLRKMCRSLGLIGEPLRASVLHHILVDDKHRTLYCNIPKVACTSWKTLLVNLTADVSEPAPPAGQRLPVHNRNYLRNKHLRPLEDYYPQEMRYRLDNYFSFLVVRHPLGRVVSAFLDKMNIDERGSNPRWTLMQREIIQRHRDGGNYSVDTNLTSSGYIPIEFHEFVKYALSHFPIDRHWLTFYDSCLPCSIRYDKVVKMETMQEDNEEVFRRMGVPREKWRIPHYNSAGSGRLNKTKVKYGDFLKSLKPAYLAQLVAFYDTDMKLFDYTANVEEV